MDMVCIENQKSLIMWKVLEVY